MKILYLLTGALDPTGAALRQEHEREHAVEVIELQDEIDYGRVVEAIASADRVICW